MTAYSEVPCEPETAAASGLVMRGDLQRGLVKTATERAQRAT